MPAWCVIVFGSGRLRKARLMIRTAVAAGVAIGIGLGGAAMAQSLRMPSMPHAATSLLVDHKDKHQHGKNKHREQEDDSDDEDQGRGRRSSAPGPWRDYAPQNYYCSPPRAASSTPYVPYAP